MKQFSSESQKTGLVGEDIACRYLENNGFDILERNYTKKWGEIDIVAKDNSGKVRFIEVKSIIGDVSREIYTQKGSIKPEDNMHQKKMERMARTVETYIADRNVSSEWQVDLVTVIMDMATKKARVKLWEDIIL